MAAVHFCYTVVTKHSAPSGICRKQHAMSRKESKEKTGKQQGKLQAKQQTKQAKQQTKQQEADTMINNNDMYKGRIPLDKREKYTFQELTDIIAALRAPDGCPWDREQTFETMKKYLVNETQEVLDAVDHRDTDNLCEELGDVLLEVLLFSQIAEDQELFDISDVVDTISRKMIRRHPHVFAGVTVSSETEQKAMWEEIKKQEKAEKQSNRSGNSANPIKNS